MKKIIFTSTALLTMLAIGVCKGAAGSEQSFYQVLPDNWQERTILFLGRGQIRAIPDNFNPAELQSLKLNENQITAIPGNFNPPKLRSLNLSKNQIEVIPDTLQLNELIRLDLSNNSIQEINAKRLLEQFPRLERIDLSGNTYLDERFIQDLRDEADKAGRRDTLKIIAKDIAVAPLGFDTKG